MRPYILLIFTAVALAFFSGRYLVKLKGPRFASSDDILEISKLKLQFQKTVTPYAIVNFTSLYYSKDQLQLMNPSIEIQGVDQTAISSTSDCSLQDMMTSVLKGDTKELLWDQVRCNQRKSIPSWFMKRAPFMHKSGSSYAYLTFKKAIENNHPMSVDWINEHLGYFHIKELHEVQEIQGPLSGIYSILANLDEKSIYDLANREGTIMTKEFLLARITYPQSYPILEYRFYKRNELNQFLEKTKFQLSHFSPHKFCLYKDGPLCWRYNVKTLFNMISFSALIVFLGVFAILIIILWALLGKIKLDRKNERRRKMALQVLSHEFRTPVASLLLSVDKINRDLSKFDEQTQVDILRISSEVYRLQRLTEKSKNYLQGHARGTVAFSFEQIDYADELVLDVMDSLNANEEKNITLKYEIDIPIIIDVYWFQIIVKNILENSIKHGQGDIRIYMYIKKNNFVLEISDYGRDEIKLEEITEAFAKGNKSDGSGLGLNIVATVIKDWGGALCLKNDPTNFVITLPIKGSKNG